MDIAKRFAHHRKSTAFMRESRKRHIRSFLYAGLGEQVAIFFEDLSILLGAGVDIISAAGVLRDEARGWRMKKLLTDIYEQLQNGAAFWRSIAPYQLVPLYVLALVKTGEESGNLPENLKVAVEYHARLRRFGSRVKSALIYPAIVIVLTGVVGLVMGVYVLPRLSTVFTSVNIPLPAMTQVLVATGDFFKIYGFRILPIALIVIVAATYIVFIWQRTRFIGMHILFVLPFVRAVIRGNEVARMGYILGILLKSGLPLIDAVASMRSATELGPYRRLYAYLKDHAESGESFQELFEQYKPARALIPVIARHIIVAGERSGALPESFIKIGETFEEKTNTALQNVTVLIEPLILIIVGVAVLFAAFAIIMPIYSLLGGVR